MYNKIINNILLGTRANIWESTDSKILMLCHYKVCLEILSKTSNIENAIRSQLINLLSLKIPNPQEPDIFPQELEIMENGNEI